MINMKKRILTIKDFIEKYYVIILIIIIAFSFARSLYENTRSENLMPWDNWNFAVMAKEIKDAGGMIPAWINNEGYPNGAPFLYPPLVPLIIAWISIITHISIFYVVKFLGFLMYPAIITSFIFLTRVFNSKTITVSSSLFFACNLSIFCDVFEQSVTVTRYSAYNIHNILCLSGQISESDNSIFSRFFHAFLHTFTAWIGAIHLFFFQKKGYEKDMGISRFIIHDRSDLVTQISNIF